MKRRSIKIIVSILAIGTIISGCNSAIHKKRQVGSIDTLSIDAKQRLVHVNELGGPKRDRTIYCAEPSPDALVAQAAALSANLTTPKSLGVALGAANNEAAGSIGLRTQTIQILRDGYYRICEAYSNGSIDEQEYQDVIDNIDGVIAVTLAIDSLGGTIAAPAIDLTPGNATTSANGDKASAETKAGSIEIENFIPDRGALSDAQAGAIENVLIAYLDHMRQRAKAKLERDIRLNRN